MPEMRIIKISKPIKKTADVLNLNLNDLDQLNSNIFSDFNNKISDNFQQANKQILNNLKNIPAFIQFMESIGKDSQNFEVVFPKGILKKLKNGEYILNRSKDAINEFIPYIKDKKTGKIVTQLRIKEISDPKLIDLSTSLQNIAIMQAIGQLSRQLESIEKKLTNIHKEFNNDRIGKIQSGYSAYLDALQMVNRETKNYALISAYKSLSEGRSQLIESTKNRLNGVETGFWNSFSKEFISISFKKDQISNIKEFAREFFFIQRTSQIILLIYQELGEPGAMVQSLAPLQDVLQIIRNEIPRLKEWDNSSTDWEKLTTTCIQSIENIPNLNQIENSEIKLKLNL